MASVGPLQFSLASAEQRTTLALADFNFDFSIVKVAAPAEYTELGLCLSSRRRKEAEDGRLHAVARKLGALFARDLPEVPNLIKAYGRRASEISANPKVNPQGSQSHGPFADHVGADGTSIWAAATSGKEALAVHLLACLLSRIWSGSQATSIWHEIVTTRKAILQKRLEGEQFHISEITASQMEIGRDKLGEWDASARAWLRTGDDAYRKQQKQLILVLGEVGKSIASGSDVYKVVTNVWKKAMVAMEKLLCGMPQSIEDPETLLGLASWHLYPDIAISGANTTIIKQDDDLVPRSGVVTIGIRSPKSHEASGISWSLPLAYLRYYGTPVVSTGMIEQNSSRVSFDQILLVGLGSLTRHWYPGAGSVSKVTDLLCALSNILESSPDPAKAPAWLRMFRFVAEKVRTARGETRTEAERLIEFGRRRGGSFVSKDERELPEAFGLGDIQTYLSLVNGVEAKVALLRERVASLNLEEINLQNAIMRYRPQAGERAKDFIGPHLRITPLGSDFDHPLHPDDPHHQYSSEFEFATLLPQRTFGDLSNEF